MGKLNFQFAQKLRQTTTFFSCLHQFNFLTLINIKLTPSGVAKTKTNPAMCKNLGLPVIKSM